MSTIEDDWVFHWSLTFLSGQYESGKRCITSGDVVLKIWQKVINLSSSDSRQRAETKQKVIATNIETGIAYDLGTASIELIWRSVGVKG
jgi:hypothetical protein